MKKGIIITATVLIALAVGMLYPTTKSSAMGPGIPGGSQLFGQPNVSVYSIESLVLNPHMQIQLGITDEEVDQVKDMVIDYKKNLINSDAKLKVLEIELAAMLDDDKPNEKSVEKKIDEISVAHAELRKNEIRTVLKVKEMLSKAQYQKLQSLMMMPPPPPAAKKF